MHESAETDDALLVYTGGTTGRAKGVRLSHANILLNALQIAYVARPRGDEPGREHRPFDIGDRQVGLVVLERVAEGRDRERGLHGGDAAATERRLHGRICAHALPGPQSPGNRRRG